MLDNIPVWLAALPPPLNAPVLIGHFFGWQGSVIAAGIGAVVAGALVWMRSART
jgi:glucose-6-phosphate-specific signal transduction histidine kinase